MRVPRDVRRAESSAREADRVGVLRITRPLLPEATRARAERPERRRASARGRPREPEGPPHRADTQAMRARESRPTAMPTRDTVPPAIRAGVRLAPRCATSRSAPQPDAATATRAGSRETRAPQ